MVSSAVFDRALTNRIENVRHQIDVLLTLFADSSKKQEERTAQAQKLATAAQDVLDILEVNDRPPWVLPMLNAARNYRTSGNTASGKELLKEILKFNKDIKPIKASVDSSEVSFDQVFQRLLREGNLPELFQQLIDQTEELINSGKIESVTILAALRRLLAVVQANKDGSFVAVAQTSFLARFIKNSGIEYLKLIPGIAPVVAGWEKTIGDIEEERKDLERKLEHESLLAVIDQATISRIETIPGQVRRLTNSNTNVDSHAPLLIEDASPPQEDASIAGDSDTQSHSD